MRRTLLLLRDHLRPLFYILDSLQFYVILYDVLLSGYFFLLLLVHAFLEVYLPLYLLQLLLLVSDSLFQLLLIAADVLVLELQFLHFFSHQIPRFCFNHVLSGLKDHIAGSVGLSKILLKLIIVDRFIKGVLNCYLVIRRIQCRLNCDFIVLNIWLDAVVIIGEFLLHCLIFKLNGGLDASLFYFWLHLHLLIFLGDDAELVGLVVH